MRVWRRRLSDAYIGPKSRKERPNKTKIGRGRPRHTWLGHHFQGQKVNCQLAEAGACCGGLPHSLSWVETSFSAAILLNVDRAGWNLTELCRCKEFSLTQICGWAAPNQQKTTFLHEIPIMHHNSGNIQRISTISVANPTGVGSGLLSWKVRTVSNVGSHNTRSSSVTEQFRRRVVHGRRLLPLCPAPSTN